MFIAIRFLVMNLPALKGPIAGMGAEPTSSRTTALADRPEGQVTTAGLLLTSILYPIGLFAPAIETRHLGWLRDDHSLAGLVWGLASRDQIWLALTVGLFSIAFPLTKLVWMWRLQFRRGVPPGPTALRWLERLGKWSMADVLIVALTVFTLQGSGWLGAQPEIGIAVFAAATVIAMLCSGRISAQLRAIEERKAASEPLLPGEKAP